MKLLIAITVAEYTERLQKYFSQYEVDFYNEIEMSGVKKLNNKHRLGNWFGQGIDGIRNMAFVASVTEEQGNNLLQEFAVCKENLPECEIQAFLIDVEKGIF